MEFENVTKSDIKYTLAICSSHLPREINTINMGVVSKNVTGLKCSARIMAAMTTSVEYRYEIDVAKTTRTSILADL